MSMLILSEKEQLIARVEDALSTIRPHLLVDGGNVEVVDITDDMRVKIRWMGMCETCSMSGMTLKAGITEAIRGKIPEITGVDPVNGI
jgi:Fe-S cluster biogenesis protein NfuA